MVKTIKKLIVFFLILVVAFLVPVCHSQVVRADDNGPIIRLDNDKELEEQAKQIVADVIDSVLKDDASKVNINEIFKTVMSGFGYINTTVSFLKLIGILKDGTGAALARIQEQLNLITDRLITMDAKLDNIIAAMDELKGETRFIARTTAARDYRKFFSDFIRDYETNGLNPLITNFESMRIDAMKKWYNAKTNDERIGEMFDNSALYLVFDQTAEGQYELKYLTINGLPEDLDEEATYLILTSEVMPIKANSDIPQWNIDTYHEALSSFFKEQMLANRDDEAKIISQNFDFDNEELVNQAAQDAVNLLVYRNTAEAVNESSTFAKTVLEKFNNYITYLLKAENGIDAMIKALYYTHVFEGSLTNENDVAYQIVKLYEAMVFEVAYYSSFVKDVIGMSSDITMNEKNNFLKNYRDTVISLEDTKQNSLTGKANYCYITNTLLYYGATQISASGTIKAHRSGAQGGYDWYTASDFTVTNWRYDDAGAKKYYSSAAQIGGDAATLISLTLLSNGEKADHNYWNQKLGNKAYPVEANNAVLVSCASASNLPFDSNTPLLTEWVLGNYFPATPTTVTLRSLPSGCESEYVHFHRQVQGSIFDFASSSLTSNTTIAAMALYGESHWYWGVDEAAFMSGPSTGRVVRNCTRTGSTSGSKTDTYDNYSVTFNYNTILQEALSPKLNAKPTVLNSLYSFRQQNDYVDPEIAEYNPNEVPTSFGEEAGFSSKSTYCLLYVLPTIVGVTLVGTSVFLIIHFNKRQAKMKQGKKE